VTARSRQAALWAATNRAVADLAAPRYLCLRIEDLLAEPEAEARRLLAFAGLPADPRDLLSEVPAGAPLSAWGKRPAAERDALLEVMWPELRRLGYEAAPGATVGPPASGIAGPAPSAPAPLPPAAELASLPRLADVDWDAFDFIDLGSSAGGSLSYCRKRLGCGPGVGIDSHPPKVARTRAAGLDAVVGDATDLRVRGAVRFVSMMDFLEHLPSLAVVEEVLAGAAEAATDFLFVHHPSFEDEEAVTALGLRQYWWDWEHHTAHVRVVEYRAMLERLGLDRRYTINYIEPIEDSTHESIHPIDPLEPHGWANQGPYDDAVHPDKPLVRFERPLWRAQEILVALRPLPQDDWDAIAARLLKPGVRVSGPGAGDEVGVGTAVAGVRHADHDSV
jgi:hypothetical protein